MTDLSQLSKTAEALSQPLCKLIDAVRAGAGYAYEPVHVKRMAKAEAEALVVQAQTDIAIDDMRARAAARLTNTELRRQENIEAITEQARLALPPVVDEHPVDDDWMANFFDTCKDIRNEDLQKIWGQLLANEVTKPGHISKRTLHYLRLVSPLEAVIFDVLKYRVWLFNEWPIVLFPYPDFATVDCPFQHHHIQILANANILHPQMDEWFPTTNEEFILDYNGARFTIADACPMPIRRYVFTPTGRELNQAVGSTAGLDDAYFKACCSFLENGWTRDEQSPFNVAEIVNGDESIFDLSRYA